MSDDGCPSQGSGSQYDDGGASGNAGDVAEGSADGSNGNYVTIAVENRAATSMVPKVSCTNACHTAPAMDQAVISSLPMERIRS